MYVWRETQSSEYQSHVEVEGVVTNTYNLLNIGNV